MIVLFSTVRDAYARALRTSSAADWDVYFRLSDFHTAIRHGDAVSAGASLALDV